ncbi:Serine/threonine protein phosphatase 2A 59 kDa regulatory subunit B' zeta isoform [Hibiscus syriacus]|uniref:Serine/threonine protein phosphatase 2A 59 kDa regulatory subunit B' zeta isoform n=1 Tax=Hibiscus syriacus TaxID=106335 RepID=A0A6A3D192_HIBSY|nr:Serine/threonine protein phosphatase 2A 59 kDa regulatory subunit B' zeta isoform [Hibiscus syriacus]
MELNVQVSGTAHQWSQIYLSDVSNPQKQSLFISKLNLCCEVSDCSDPDKTSAEQDLKHQMLLELVDFVSSGSARFNESAIAAMCKMCAINLFRAFPPKYCSNSTSGEVEDEEPMFDPSWSNLLLVYDLLLRFISCTSLDAKVAKTVYGKVMVHRPFVRNAVSNIIYRFVFETERHNGIAELLEIFGSIISGFAVPLKEEHKMFLWRALIPLHKPKAVVVYHQQLTFCVVQFIDKDPKLANSVITGLLKYWPVTNSPKELLFISELEEILEMTSMAEFVTIMVPLFRRISFCLNSSHYQVAERAHLPWNNEHIFNLIMHNRRVIFPLIFPALERNSGNHWNQAVLNLTHSIKMMFCEIDEELVLACQRKLEEENSRSSEAAEKRKMYGRLKPSACTVAC